MNPRDHLAIIGSGPSAIYVLKHLLDEARLLKPHLGQISIFEKSPVTGTGMPYSPQTTDVFNMSNISSEELPELPITFGDWLRAQEPDLLKSFGIEKDAISDGEVYSRLALGQYLQTQYQTLIAGLNESGIPVHEHAATEITDIQDHPSGDRVTLLTSKGDSHDFDRVIIATGHQWPAEDKPESGYYASPWPIFKLLPGEGEHHNFTIGTLGSSLSAFDVIASLAYRHGDFITDEKSGRMTFRPHPDAEKFKIIMHSSQGLLPHLQFDQVEPFREIYRHVDRHTLLGLIDSKGFLRIETYFDQVCRPALIKALEEDGLTEMIKQLADPHFGLLDFIEKMGDKHDYDNAFEGMRFEMVEAKKSVENHKPIHWKEVLDDLMYTLNFHAEYMPAEDHLTLHSKVMPFLLNVVAAMPLTSGNTILALYDAGKLGMISGKVTVAEDQDEKGLTKINVEDNGKESTHSYRMFIDCSGQKPLELEDYPFPSLVKNGAARKARAAFASSKEAEALPPEKQEHLFKDHGQPLLHTGGIQVDAPYRLIAKDGQSIPRIYDIAFPHTTGVRPYSYGLQACNHTAAILVQSWVQEIKASTPVENDLTEATKIYEKV